MAKEIKLLGFWASQFALRARISLHIKSVDYELLEEKSLLYDKSELLLQSNPVHKKVPVLIHNGKPICESLIIVEYVDEVFSSSGPSILPSDPYDLAIQRFWASYIDNQWYPAFYEVVHATDEETRAKAIEKVQEGLQLLEGAFIKCSKGKPYFNGDTLGYLDIAFGCFIGWLRVVGKMYDVELLSAKKTPNLFAWADTFCAHDAVKDYMPKTEKLIEFANLMKDKFEAEAATQNK